MTRDDEWKTFCESEMLDVIMWIPDKPSALSSPECVCLDSLSLATLYVL